MKNKNFKHRINITLHYNKGSKVADSIEVEGINSNSIDMFLAAISLLEKTQGQGMNTSFFARMFETYAQLAEED